MRLEDDTLFLALDSAARGPLPRPLTEALLGAIAARFALPQPLALPVYENPDTSRAGWERPAAARPALSVEGRARLEFVVTEAGRVDARTLRVRSFTHPAFAAAVAESLQRAAYRPGLVAGCPVKMLVAQPFEFHLAR